MENPLHFLKKKYNLHNTPEVKAAARRTEIREGEKVSQNPNEQMQNYLDRFKEIIDRKNPADREQGMEALKRVLYRNFVTKEDEIPEGYYQNQARIAREQGHGDIEISDEQKKQLAEVVIADQRSSLDLWTDYLASKDATYPDWLKYYAFRNVVAMGSYDKEKKQFGSRSKETVKPFPDLNREALAYVLDAIEKKTNKEHVDLDHLEGEQRQNFEKLLAGESFPKLYAWAIDKLTPASQEQLMVTKGEWKKYEQGEDHMGLVKSLQGHGTGWCTAGESTAKSQLENGDFHVYYSQDAEGHSSVPRAAIRMQGDQIAEVRGIAEQQNLDAYIAPVVEEKMKEFPDGKSYEKKSQDMKMLTIVENKSKLGQKLNKEELVFIYEINGEIQGFGYERDPRINEVRELRNPIEDAPVVFECSPDQIATSIADITENTKAYIGPLEKGIFANLPSTVEHVYTKFPEGRIVQKEIKLGTGPKTADEFEAAMVAKGYQVSSWSKDMMKQSAFKVSPEQKDTDLVFVSVESLGFPDGAEYQDIQKRAVELALELAPAEVGPQLRLQYDDQPNGEWLRVGMEAITDSVGDRSVFRVVCRVGGKAWLGNDGGFPGDLWRANYRFVFVRPRK